MPTYDYVCPSNNQALEVSHSMSRRVITWGELCALAGIEPGPTPAEAPVERLVSMAQPLAGGAKSAGYDACCSPGGDCAPASSHCCSGPGCCRA